MATRILARTYERLGIHRSKLQEPFWALASQVVTSGANFITTILFIRAAGLTEFGRFSIAYLIMMIVRNFLIGAVLTPMSSITPKLRPSTLGAYRGFLLANGIIFSLSISALLYFGAQLSGRYTDLFWLDALAPSLAVAILTACMADFFRRFQFVTARSARAFVIDFIRFSTQLGLLTILAFEWGESFNSQSTLFCIATGASVAIGIGAIFYGNIEWNWSLSYLMWLRHWNFTKWLVPSIALESLQNAIPQFAAAAILGESSLGLIKATQQLTNVLNLPLNAVQQVLPSIAAARLKRSGYASMTKLLKQSGFLIALLSIGLGITVLAESSSVASLLSIGNSSGFRWLLALYVTLNLILAIRIPSLILINTVEDPMANFVATALGVANATAFSYILIRTIGEVAVPLLGIVNAILVWSVIVIWANRNSESYRMLFKDKAA